MNPRHLKNHHSECASEASACAVGASEVGACVCRTQTFGFTLTVTDADLFSCEDLLSPLMLGANVSAMIGNEWIAGFASPPAPGRRPRPTPSMAQPTTHAAILADDIRAVHPHGPGLEGRSTCQVELLVRRKLIIFVVKRVLPTIVIVYASIASLYMDAMNNAGDRMAVQLVGALILIVNVQSDLGLG